MGDTARARRLAKRIAQIVASGLEYEVKDPRLAMVTITDARLTSDLRDATVYYTVFGDDADYASTAAALASAAGVLRTRVGQQTGVRFTPTLTFVADTVPGDVRRLDEALAQAKEADAEVARLASTAAPAGDADPYRTSEANTGNEDESADGTDVDTRTDNDARRGPSGG
ncbi:30S ribosome-binding factor RbfA [Haloactinomyces albus]|uniref:Ribosome-binding factor A n=1 Tax=Haloactinomyces albus TaxID=1352928 RepID=A0AAE4CNG7_9ACTN|nr:30S ribosome-binding factor RbfA [Haloactinomyces albus]MDR7300643.1 ribosome-binding factor A [Haloactinomyces albus]